MNQSSEQEAKPMILKEENESVHKIKEPYQYPKGRE